MENRPVGPGSIQGSHRPISFIRIKNRTRATIFCVKLSINNHIVGLVHKNHIIRTCLMYHAACKVEFQPFNKHVLTADVFQLPQKIYTWYYFLSWKTSAVSTTVWMVNVSCEYDRYNINVAKRQPWKYFFKLKNVSCEYDCLNGWNSTLQAAWYIRHVRVVFLWTINKPTIWLLTLIFTKNRSLPRILCFILMKDMLY